MLFGFAGGVLYILAGVTLGALIAYTIGHFLGREFMARHLSGRFLAIEQAVANRGIVAVIISRMIPFVPFCVANYVFGTTRVRRTAFITGTMLGALPATIAYAALGSATARGDTLGMSLAGVMIATLGVGGSIGTYLVWRRRPRKQVGRSTAHLPDLAPPSASRTVRWPCTAASQPAPWLSVAAVVLGRRPASIAAHEAARRRPGRTGG